MSTYLEEQIATTKDIIESEPTVITIVRPPVKVRQPDGSAKRGTGEPDEVDPQTFFFTQVVSDSYRSISWQGEQVLSRWVIVGMPDADLREGDTFTVYGRKYTVVDLVVDQRWEARGWLVDRS